MSLGWGPSSLDFVQSGKLSEISLKLSRTPPFHGMVLWHWTKRCHNIFRSQGCRPVKSRWRRTNAILLESLEHDKMELLNPPWKKNIQNCQWFWIFSDILRHSPTCGMAEVAEAMVPAPEPCNEPRPRRHSDELASAQAPLAPLALWQRPHRGLRLCESPDFGRPREPRDHRDHREHRDWRPPLSQSTRMKGDIFGGYKEMSIPTQATFGWRGIDSPMYAPCCVYIYICITRRVIYIHIFICLFIYSFISIFKCIFIFIYLYSYIIHSYIHTFIFIFIHVCICLYVMMCKCGMTVYNIVIYVYLHRHMNPLKIPKIPLKFP